MKRCNFIIILLIFCWKGYSQNKGIPIMDEIPKRGIYKTFEEFKFNVPSITDSFYVESKIRAQKNWEGTTSLIPRYDSNGKKVKKVWGFSDGQHTYAFHQWEFFKIRLDSSILGFYAYKELLNPSVGSVAAGAVGGAIGGGLYSALAIENAKNKRIYYVINLLNGKLNSSYNINYSEGSESQLMKLIVYRRGKNEKEEPLKVSFNDTLTFQLTPNSLKEFNISISREPVKLCYGNNPDQCTYLTLIPNETKYLEGSISSKKNDAKLEQVKVEVGEFYSNRVRYLQDKRLGLNDKTINIADDYLTKLIVYRKGKKEKEEPLNISLNDTLKFQLIPNSLKELEIPISSEPVRVCYGSNLNECIDLFLVSSETKYLEGSISSKNNKAKVEQVKVEVGEFYSKQAKYLQDKREDKDSRVD